jgi:hypothetical protein
VRRRRAGPSGVIALDGTKVAANAADKANRTLDKLQTEVEQILREAAEIDQAEDRQHGPARGDELPAALASPSGRLARLRQAKAQLEAEAAERQRRYQQRVNELAAAARARGQQPKAHYRPRRRDEAPNPKAVANTTDPDSRFLHTRNGTVQGYNAQAVVTEGQIVVAAELTREANDLQQLQPMLQAGDQTLSAADVHQRPGMLLADSGYWSIANLTSIPDAPQLLVWPSRTGRTGKPRKDGKPSASRSDGLRAAMFAKLTSEAARPATRCTSRPSNPSSGSSRSSRAPAGSAAAGWPPATRSGSCCPAPTTCSSSGATRTTDRHPRRPPPERQGTPPSRAASADPQGCSVPPQTRSGTGEQSKRLLAASGGALSATRCQASILWFLRLERFLAGATDHRGSGGPGRPRTCDRRIMSRPTTVYTVPQRSVPAGRSGGSSV